jgi:hypothetical protein
VTLDDPQCALTDVVTAKAQRKQSIDVRELLETKNDGKGFHGRKGAEYPIANRSQRIAVLQRGDRMTDLRL